MAPYNILVLLFFFPQGKPEREGETQEILEDLT